MSFFYSSTDESNESISSKSLQNCPSTSEEAKSSNLSETSNHDGFDTIFNSSRAFWNLPADDSTKTENEQDARINADETLSSRNDRDMDEMAYYVRALSLFYRISVWRWILEGRLGSRQTKSAISKLLNTRNVCHLLLTIPAMLVPASAVAIGVEYIGHCPANWLLPHFMLLIGVLSTIVMTYAVVGLSGKYFSTFEGKDVHIVGKTFGCFLAILMLIEIILFFYTPLSSDTSSKNYCNSSFYFYVAFINILSLAFVIGGGLVKLIYSIALVNPSYDFVEEDLGF